MSRIYTFCDGAYAVVYEAESSSNARFSILRRTLDGTYVEDCRFTGEDVIELIEALRSAVRQNTRWIRGKVEPNSYTGQTSTGYAVFPGQEESK